MSRRDFIKLLPTALAASSIGSAAAAGAPSAGRATPRSKQAIRGVCFDLFTLFNPRGVVTQAASILTRSQDAAALCEAWRTRQFEYSWLRASAGQYLDFERVTADALSYATRALGLSLSDANRRALIGAYSELSPYPDTREHLTAFKARGLKLAPLANYSPAMLRRLLAKSGLTQLFDEQISTDAARTFKPDPRAYALGMQRLGLPKEAIAFSAFGGWDAAGAQWFGYATFWVNRLGVSPEQLVAIDGTGADLAALARFIASWS